MHKKILLAGAIFSLASVAIGAFGAHGLKSTLEANQHIATFETAVLYQMFHSMGLLFLGLWSSKKPSKFLTYSAFLFVSGILIFSGSLYLLSICNIAWLGAITPIGGLSFIAGWTTVIIQILKDPTQD
ncbi:MAG: DUF423 domain-containing protein [Cyclobacteriaceae bacterium]